MARITPTALTTAPQTETASLASLLGRTGIDTNDIIE